MNKNFLFLAIFSAGYPNFGIAKSPKEDNGYPPAMTNKMRLKLAEMHQEIASCLKAGKTFEDCRKDMANSCHDFAQMMPMRGSSMMQQQGLMMKGSHKIMTGYPGMMTAFCENKCSPSDSKESQTQE